MRECQFSGWVGRGQGLVITSLPFSFKATLMPLQVKEDEPPSLPGRLAHIELGSRRFWSLCGSGGTPSPRGQWGRSHSVPGFPSISCAVWSQTMLLHGQFPYTLEGRFPASPL